MGNKRLLGAALEKVGKGPEEGKGRWREGGEEGKDGMKERGRGGSGFNEEWKG